MGLLGNLCGLFRVKIHVGKAGGAALDHLCHGQLGAVTDKLLADPLIFGWPDVIFQPFLQGLIISEAAQQAHGSVAMRITRPGITRWLVRLMVCSGMKRLSASSWGIMARMVPLWMARAQFSRTRFSGTTGTIHRALINKRIRSGADMLIPGVNLPDFESRAVYPRAPDGAATDRAVQRSWIMNGQQPRKLA